MINNKTRTYKEYEWTSLYTEKKLAPLTVSDCDIDLEYKRLMPEGTLYKRQKTLLE